MLLSLLGIFRTNLNEVHFTEFFERRRVKDVEDGDDVFVVEVTEEFDFAEGAEAEHCMVEGRNALDRNLSPGRYVHRRTIETISRLLIAQSSGRDAPHNSVRTLTFNEEIGGRS